MNILESSLESCTVDGEKFLLPNRSEWKLIRNGATIGDRKVLLVEDTLKSVEKVDSYSDLLVGLHRGAPIRRGWSNCILYKDENTIFHRVILQKAHCKNCDWYGLIANPCFPDLYYGSSQKDEAYLRSKLTERVGCPSCGTELVQHAIWAG